MSLERIRNALAQPSGAASAVPDGRADAAVAVILRERGGEVQVLLIRRAARDGDPWSGQMGLPGGHRDPVDVDLTATAQRETMEEVGLDLRSGGRPLGLLPSVLVRPAVHGIRMTVTPFVFEMVGEASVAVGSEVEAVIWADLGPLARHERDTTFCFVRDGRQVERPAWDVDGHVVWGLTYEMLGSLLQSLKRLGGDNAAPAR